MPNSWRCVPHDPLVSVRVPSLALTLSAALVVTNTEYGKRKLTSYVDPTYVASYADFNGLFYPRASTHRARVAYWETDTSRLSVFKCMIGRARAYPCTLTVTRATARDEP
jgi:hypothetical protein